MTHLDDTTHPDGAAPSGEAELSERESDQFHALMALRERMGRQIDRIDDATDTRCVRSRIRELIAMATATLRQISN